MDIAHLELKRTKKVQSRSSGFSNDTRADWLLENESVDLTLVYSPRTDLHNRADADGQRRHKAPQDMGILAD